MDLKAIKAISFEQMAGKRSHPWKEKGNKYYHGERVANTVRLLRKAIFPSDDSHDDILTVAAWFHDIRNGMDNHCAEGALITGELIKDHCNDSELKEVCNIINCHDDRTQNRHSYDIYVKLHQDADHLDHFGTFDIWTIFISAPYHGESIAEVKDWLVSRRPLKDNEYRSELNFDLSRTIYDEKAEFLRSFTERFAVECTGGIWNMDELKKRMDEKDE